jgi:hypothetical protein
LPSSSQAAKHVSVGSGEAPASLGYLLAAFVKAVQIVLLPFLMRLVKQKSTFSRGTSASVAGLNTAESDDNDKS